MYHQLMFWGHIGREETRANNETSPRCICTSGLYIVPCIGAKIGKVIICPAGCSRGSSGSAHGESEIHLYDNRQPRLKEHINVLLVSRRIVKEGSCKWVHAEPKQIEACSSCSRSRALVVFLPARLLQPTQIIGLIPSRLLPPGQVIHT